MLNKLLKETPIKTNEIPNWLVTNNFTKKIYPKNFFFFLLDFAIAFDEQKEKNFFLLYSFGNIEILLKKHPSIDYRDYNFFSSLKKLTYNKRIFSLYKFINNEKILTESWYKNNKDHVVNLSKKTIQLIGYKQLDLTDLIYVKRKYFIKNINIVLRKIFSVFQK